MECTKVVNSNIQSKVLNGSKTPHSTSYPTELYIDLYFLKIKEINYNLFFYYFN